MNRIWKAVALIGLSAVALTGCGGDNNDDNPKTDSDSSFSYDDSARVPVDEATYELTGEVVGQVNNLTRQVEPGKGSISGSQYGSYGTLSGSFTGPIEAGKGFVRLKVSVSKPATDLAPVGEVAIVKTADTKASALMPGDIVTFKCRRQYENIAAVKDKQEFKESEVGTWELDYCRFETPVLQIK